jgi:hypothetical protein
LAVLAKGVAAFCTGNWQRALDYCDQAEVVFRDRCTGVAWELDTTRTLALWSLNFMGRVAELSRRWHEQVQDALLRGDLFALTNLRTFNMATVRLAADDPQGARSDLQEAIGVWSQEGYHMQHHNALLAHVYIELYTENSAAAWNQVTKNWRAFWSSLLGRIQNIRIQMLLMYTYSALAVAAAAVDPTSLLRKAGWGARRLRRERVSWAHALDGYIQATIAARRGDTAGAHRLLAKAATAFEAAGMGLHAACTRRRLGMLVGGAEGQGLMAQADAWMWPN